MSSGRGYGSTSTEYRDDPGESAGFGRYSDRGPGAPRPSYQTAASSNGAAHIAEKISTNIFKINSNSTTLERASKQIGEWTTCLSLVYTYRFSHCFRQWHLWSLPPANEVAARWCFYTCLWFCSQGASLSRGSLSRGISVRETPRTVKRGRYASYCILTLCQESTIEKN